ncbi:hypothetical protein G6F65_019390 [Rhizopus arrhizus]|nr:hypothetical protein G6F65_019390 [Rhizopus arrhizus]
MQHPNKRRMLRALAASAALLSGAALLGGSAQAAGYPERPINLIVSYGPGGGTDLVARMMAPFLQKYLGNDARIVVLNRPGAGGAIASAQLARAKPDGYTLLMVLAAHAINPSLYPSLPYDTRPPSPH